MAQCKNLCHALWQQSMHTHVEPCLDTGFRTLLKLCLRTLVEGRALRFGKSSFLSAILHLSRPEPSWFTSFAACHSRLIRDTQRWLWHRPPWIGSKKMEHQESMHIIQVWIYACMHYNHDILRISSAVSTWRLSLNTNTPSINQHPDSCNGTLKIELFVGEICNCAWIPKISKSYYHDLQSLMKNVDLPQLKPWL